MTLPDPNDLPPQDDSAAAPQPPREDAPPEFDFSDPPSAHELEAMGFTPLPAASIPTRRRRARRPMVARPSEDEIADRLDAMARRAVPTFDYFVFSVAAAALLGVGYLLDSPAILFFGVIAAPLLTPWMGAALAVAAGEARYLGQTLGGFFTSLLIFLLVGMLSGLASRLFLPLTFSQATFYARLWWPNLLLLALGTLIFVLSFIQSDEKPILPGLMLSYALYLPISAAGFGIGNGVEGIFPQALLVFFVQLAISLLLALAVFYYMGFRPLEASGYLWGAGAILLSLALIGGIAGLGTLLARRSAEAAQAALVTPSPTIALPTLTPQPFPATSTLRPATLPVATALPVTASPSPLPTPFYGKIQSQGDGAVIRKSPDGPAITTIQNGYVVEILSDAPVSLASGTTWIHVRVKTTTQVLEGWVQLSLVVTSTPAP